MYVESRGAQRAGLNAETAVIQLLTHKKWQLVLHRFKTHIAEVDLIFEKEDQVLLIEVKTLNDNWRVFERIGEQQVKRLRMNGLLFAGKFKNKKIKILLAWVDRKNRISFCNVEN